jgi:thiamine-monophosphate kinase
MGLQLLIREKEVYKINPNSQPDLSGYEHILEKQLKPEAQIEILDKLAKMNVMPSSMIDISDGLSSEIIHICKASDTGCVIHEEKLPIDNETLRFGQEIEVHGTIAALNGGEDYELLFTVPLSDFDTIKRYPEISVIGHITNKDKGYSLITGDGNSIPLEAQGFSHSN